MTTAIDRSADTATRRTLFVDIAAPGFIVAYLTVALGPLQALIIPPGSLSTTVLPAMGLVILALTPTDRLRRIPISFAFLGFALWCAISVAWSNSPASTTYLTRYELVPMLIAFFVAGTIRPRVLATTFLYFCIGVCAWSILTSLALPSYRVADLGEGMGEQLGFRGMFIHKNQLGTFGVITLAAALPLLHVRGRRVILLLLIGMVLATRSATAGSGLLTLGFVWLWALTIDRGQTRRDRQLLRAVSTGLAGVALLSAFRLLPVLLALYDKDITFSGRTIIWSGVLETAMEQPLQGFGFAGVWTDQPTSLMVHLWRLIGFEAAHSHNAVVELLLEVGAIGLLLGLLIIASIVRRSIRLRTRDDTRDYGLWGYLFVASFCVMSLAEPMLSGPYVGIVAVILATLSNLDNEHVHRFRRPSATSL